MFVIKLFVNRKEIREIMVQNTGERTMIGDYLYEVKKPKLGQPKLVHDRDAGDLVLALKTIKLVQEQERKFPEEES